MLKARRLALRNSVPPQQLKMAVQLLAHRVGFCESKCSFMCNSVASKTLTSANVLVNTFDHGRSRPPKMTTITYSIDKGAANRAAVDGSYEEWEAATEDAIAKATIASFPWPEYGTFEPTLSFKARAEYSEWNHELCKEMYASFFGDKEVARRCGESIAGRGGFQALQGVYFACHTFAASVADQHDCSYTALRIRCAPLALQHAWDGIAGWQA